MTAAIRPAYGTASLCDVLPSALAVLTGTGPDPLGLAALLPGVRRIAVLLVDGLGYHLLPAAVGSAAIGSPAIGSAEAAGGALVDVVAGKLGTLTALTTGFPSTTPVSLVGLGTGVPPGVHGVLGFTVRVPGSRRVLNHIRWGDSPDPRAWQPVPTMFERAAAAGVAAVTVTRPHFAGSGLTVAAYRGARFVGAGDVDALAAQMRLNLAADVGPTLVYGYHPELDHAGHVHGVTSPEWARAAVDVDRLVSRLAADLPADSALLVTADHGQLDVPADARFDLDGGLGLRDGVVVVAGEPRVRYLHVAPGAEVDVMATWRGVLGDAARVMTRDEVVDEGWFGAVSPAHIGRIGDVVVVCRSHHAVLASHVEPGEGRSVAFHGSWTPVEMEIPLIVVPGSA